MYLNKQINIFFFLFLLKLVNKLNSYILIAGATIAIEYTINMPNAAHYLNNEITTLVIYQYPFRQLSMVCFEIFYG